MSLMSVAPEPHPHPRPHPLARRLLLLAVLLLLALPLGWRLWSLTRTSTLSTAAPTFTCTPADTRNQVLTSGSLTVKVPYGDVLHYVDDAIRHPFGNLVTFWTNAQALALTLGSATPDDFRCVVTDMERAHVGQLL
jgi:hypothetical protein